MKKKVFINKIPSSSKEKGAIYYNKLTKKYSTDKMFTTDMPSEVYMSNEFNEVIASTENDSLPNIPESFIKKLCVVDIPHAMIEMETNDKPKLRKNNTVIVSKIRDVFTRDEILKMLDDNNIEYTEKVIQDYLNSL